MVLEEKEIPYTLREENLGNLSPELLALHPEGRVPLLIIEEEGEKWSLYQSSIITEFLDESFAGLKLMPDSPKERAKVRRWTYWCDNLFKPDLDLYKYEAKKISSDELQALLLRLEEHLTLWDRQISHAGFLVCQAMTLADIHLFPFARQFFAITPPYPELHKYPHLSQWLERMMGRTSFSRVMKKQPRDSSTNCHTD